MRRGAVTCRCVVTIDFDDLPVFEAASAYPVIVVTKKEPATSSVAYLPVHNLEPPYPDVRAMLKVAYTLPRSAVDGPIWRLTTESSTSYMWSTLASGHSVELQEYVRGKIFYGVKTGLNSAFFINQATRNELIQRRA